MTIVVTRHTTHYIPAAVLGAVHQDQVRRQERETQQDVHISASQIFYLSQIFFSHGIDLRISRGFLNPNKFALL